ncbi:DUF6883 domain-containing protein [Azospirillum endophyticum]
MKRNTIFICDYPGRAPLIRSVWFVAAGEDVPRLVTAYPEQGSKE